MLNMDDMGKLFEGVHKNTVKLQRDITHGCRERCRENGPTEPTKQCFKSLWWS